MKINETQRLGSVQPYKRASGTNSTGGLGKPGKKDEISISAEAMELAGGLRPGDQQHRIDTLKQSVSTGTYQVDASKIAEKLLPYLQ